MTSIGIAATWIASASDPVRVVADTGPLNYLVLIGCVDVLPGLFTGVSIPSSVRQELGHPETPEPVRDWLASSPPWLVVRPAASTDAVDLSHLDRGERDAIPLAEQIHADLVLMDERAGVTAARARGLAVTGTLGLLDRDRGARRGLLDLRKAVMRLRETSFRCRPALLQSLLDQHGTR